MKTPIPIKFASLSNDWSFSISFFISFPFLYSFAWSLWRNQDGTFSLEGRVHAYLFISRLLTHSLLCPLDLALVDASRDDKRKKKY